MNKRSKGFKYTKKMTVKAWKKFDKWAERENGEDYSMQEVLLRFYDVILIDHKAPSVGVLIRTNKEKTIAFLKHFNQKNLDKGLKIFDKGMEEFSKGINDFSKAFDADNKSVHKKNQIKIWSDPPKSKKRKKKSRKKKVSQDQKNVEKLMGSNKPRLF